MGGMQVRVGSKCRRSVGLACQESNKYKLDNETKGYKLDTRRLEAVASRAQRGCY